MAAKHKRAVANIIVRKNGHTLILPETTPEAEVAKWAKHL